MIETACPLDCYDACAVVHDPQSTKPLKANTKHPTSNGALCPLLNRYIIEAPRITEPIIDGKTVSMDEVLDTVASAMKEDTTLLWRGSGHLGVMQDITNLLMKQIGGTTTRGSLCDGAGQAGILEGRGYNIQLPPEQIAQADVVVVWGRNLTTTNSHMLPYIDGKQLIVIDPMNTPIAQKADMHIQLRPRSDMLLAIMMARFVIMQSLEDIEWLDKYGSEYDDFYEFTQGFRIQKSLREIDITGTELSKLVDMLIGRKVVFLLGVGIQKYSIGHYVFWAIDSLAATLGLFGRDGCGVSYLGESTQGFDSPFKISTPTVPIVDTPFDRFDTVLVQGGNPAASMPNSTKVVESLQKVKSLIYFGLYHNETSKLAKIVIPAQNFLEKNDLRLCYGHQYATKMNKAIEAEYGISEYQLTKELLIRLGEQEIALESEYLSIWQEQLTDRDTHPTIPDYSPIPYSEGFGKNSGEEFVFIDEFYDKFEEPYSTAENQYWLLSPKSTKSLNTQFQRGDRVYIPSIDNIKNGDRLSISSEYGAITLIAEIDSSLRTDCICIPSGTIGLNHIIPDIISQEGDSACYQEVKVEISKVETI